MKEGMIMELRELYFKLGGSYDELIHRLRHESLIKKYIIRFLDDDTYKLMCEAFLEQDYELAFRLAHSFKGICLNIGLTSLHHDVNEFTELLRHYEQYSLDELSSAYKKMSISYKETLSHILQYKMANEL